MPFIRRQIIGFLKIAKNQVNRVIAPLFCRLLKLNYALAKASFVKWRGVISFFKYAHLKGFLLDLFYI